jgi:gluconokinase
MIIVLMGPAGAGKTTVGRALARATHWPFYDADDLHPPGNIEKMTRGVPLTDDDRRPWLARIRALMVDLAARNGDAVLACSALRERYRTELTEGLPGVHFVMLDADRALLERRLATRRGHFAAAGILDSQLADLEVPQRALTVSAAQPVEALVAQICAAFGLPRPEDPDGGL